MLRLEPPTAASLANRGSMLPMGGRPLRPTFVVGRARSGTSVLRRVLRLVYRRTEQLNLDLIRGVRRHGLG